MSKPGIMNTKERYGVVAQLLHWAVAILILFLLALGKYMSDLPIGTSDQIAYKVWFYSLHKTVGLTVFGIALLRVFWALISKHPEPLHPERKLETFAASTVHWILYIAILLVPIAGYLHHAASVGFAPIWGPFPETLAFIPKVEGLAHYAGLMHAILSAMMGISILAHIGGALKHVVIDRDGTLARMIPFKDITLSGFVAFGRDGYKAPFAGAGAAPAFLAIMLFAGAFVVGGGYYFWMNQHAAPAAQAAAVEAPAVSPEVKAAPAINAAGVPIWQVDEANSQLGITIRQLGSPVTGAFDGWSADIAFDPDNLEASEVTVKIDINSLTLGTVTDQAKSADFLNAERFPEAVYFADQFEKTESGYIAKGSLALHGVKLALDLPFQLSINGNQAGMTGTVSINRIAYGIGAQGFADEGSVAFDVVVDITLVANK